MKNKIVIIRGPPASGKSTTFQNLRKSKKLNEYVFVNHPLIKNMFEGHSEKDILQKKVLASVLKEIMKSNKNIILEEMAIESMNKLLGKSLKKYNYDVVSFRLEVTPELTYKRDIQRVKNKNHDRKEHLSKFKRLYGGKTLNQKQAVISLHDMWKKRRDKRDIVIDTSKLTKKQVVEFIVERLG